MKKENIGQSLLAALLLLATSHFAWAEAPEGYYDSAEGLNKGALLEELEAIVGDHTNIGYSGLWDIYKESDVRDDGTIWDMYSTAKFKPGKDQCGNYSAVGDCYNREHSMPKSWFDDASPMYSDAFHIYPTDGKVNGQRSNYPFGECANGTTLSSSGSAKALGKLGKSTYPGYSGTVFEPDDEYKGDFARTYFYMAAAYNSRIEDWHSDQLAGNSYPAFSSWTVNMLLEWNRQDPVSEKEINRNEVVYEWQHNRNPFIDHPELAEYIWGDKKDQGWVPGGGSTDPEIIEPAQGNIFDLGVTSTGRTVSQTITVKGQNLTEAISVALQGDAGFSTSTTSISASQANNGNGAGLNITFASSTAGDYTTTITLSSSEIGQISFTAKAQVVNGIPALEAINVTQTSFTARWVCIDNTTTQYSLSVFDSQNSLLPNYPVQVNAGNESYNVTGLNANTTYHYSLSGGSSTGASNVIYVTTADINHDIIFSPSTLPPFTSMPGVASAETQVEVHTENIYDPVAVTVTGNFEMSLDRSNWSNEITLDPDGETFYLRMKATRNEGGYTGVLSAKSGEYESIEVDVVGNVAATATFIEDFEWEGYPGSYYTGSFEGNACSWDIESMYLATSSTDHPNDEMCARLRNGSLEMANDKQNGAGTLTFYGAVFNNDEDSEVTISYSTNGGISWKTVGNAVLTTAKNNKLAKYTYAINVAGNVRLRFEQNSGDRINIDDISITNYAVSSTNLVTADGRDWDAYASATGQLTLTATEPCTIEIYSIDAEQVYYGEVATSTTVHLDKGIYIVVSGNTSKKVIVK